MSTVDEIKSRLDILDVVSQYVQLQKSGRSYKAACPFHTERTPSFYVFPERQSWRCFGACASGGDLFSFLMRIENLEFSDALKRLAQQSGVKLPEKGARRSEQDVLYQINEAALEFFSQLLASPTAGADARAYLERRGLDQDTTDRFQLGLSPGDGASLKGFLASKGYREEQLALVGLITQGQGGDRYRDLFRRRLMFPIRDAEGRLSGFGGRSMDDSSPKYINSPRSPLFDKSQILYALHLARTGVAEKGIVIVEGYMDAIAAHQHGFSNVVASMGTSLTQQQVTLLLRLLRRTERDQPAQVVMAMDPDVAGQEATLRSLESSWNVFQSKAVAGAQGANLYQRAEAPSLKVAPLPPGKDPDRVIRENPEEWSELVENAQPFMDYLFLALSSRLDLTTPRGKSRLAELLFPLIAATPDPFQQDHYFRRLADRLGVSEATLQASLGRPRHRERKAPSRQSRRDQSERAGTAASVTPFATMEHEPLEEYCLALLLRHTELSEPEDIQELEDAQASPSLEGSRYEGGLRPEYFRRVSNRELFTNWMKCSKLEALEESLDEELKGHLAYLLAKELPPSDLVHVRTAWRDCVRRLEERYLRELKREEELRLSEAPSEELEGQEQEILTLNERFRHIFQRSK